MSRHNIQQSKFHIHNMRLAMERQLVLPAILENRKTNTFCAICIHPLILVPTVQEVSSNSDKRSGFKPLITHVSRLDAARTWGKY
jgi:hypothetical protein